jgi:hypothetical protein
MDRPRLIRGLRIAVSSVCGIVCLLLVVLWVRSYWREDFITAPGDGSQRVASEHGWLTIRWKDKRAGSNRSSEWSFVSISTEEREELFKRNESRFRGRQGRYVRPTFQFRIIDSGAVQFHYFLPTLVFAALTVIPWLPWKFSLRALLIANTLVAVQMGLMVWSMS